MVADNMQKRVRILCTTDLAGGACRAAMRLCHALRETAKVDATMLVNHRLSDALFVDALPSTLLRTMSRKLIQSISRTLLARQEAPPNVNSLALTPSLRAKYLTEASAISHLHWVNGDMMSIAEIGRIMQPVVWTLHDTWPFCGTEHYPYDINDRRYAAGYTSGSRPYGHRGLDLDQWTWQRKRRHWRTPIFLICPSRWMQSCAQSSPLTGTWPSAVIPNTLDTEVYKPLDRSFCRHALALPDNAALVLFGAVQGTRDPRKGFDLLIQMLKRLAAMPQARRIECVVFGQSEPWKPLPIPVPVHWIGRIGDDWTLALLYNAADVFVLPSRQENLPQTATEAQSCGCPVVAFDVCGMPDAVAHGVSGYLAAPYDTAELAHAVARVLNDPDWSAGLAAGGRERALRLWSHAAVIPQHLDVYRSLRRSAAARSDAGH